MIELEVMLAFVGATALLVAIPGPNVAVIMATSAQHGYRAGLAVIFGTTIAQALQMALVVLGLAAVIELWSMAFFAIKWLGIAYLVWIAIRMLRTKQGFVEASPASGRFFLRGAATALANPKTLVFHAAFLPLFINPEQAVAPQLALLAGMFLAVAVVLDCGWALGGSRLGKMLRKSGLSHWIDRVAGGTMLIAAGWLALKSGTQRT